MPTSDFWKTPTISIAQALGALSIVFIGFEFYYNSDNTTKIVNDFLIAEDEYKEENRQVHSEHKALIYRTNSDTKDYLNGRINNRVDPIEERVNKMNDWIEYRKGYLEAQEKYEQK